MYNHIYNPNNILESDLKTIEWHSYNTGGKLKTKQQTQK